MLKSVPGLNFLPKAKFKECVGIDLSANRLKIIHLRLVNNKLEILSMISRSISGLIDNDISKLLSSSFNELKPKKPLIAIIIPTNLVITKNIEIPSTDSQEIKEIINLQAGRHTPYSRDEIIVDYLEVGTYKLSYTKILLVIVGRNVARKNYDILERAGIKAEHILLSAEGIASYLPKLLKISTKETPICAIHIDESSSEFMVILKDKSIFVRAIPIGAQHLIDDLDKFQPKFAEEVKKSLEVYQSEDVEKAPLSGILIGAVDGLEGLGNLLSEVLRLPVKVPPVLKSFDFSPEALKAAATFKGVSFLHIISCLAAKDALKVNLIPDDIKVKKLIQDKGTDLVKTGIFVLCIFVLTFFILTSKIYFKGVYLKKLDARFQQLSLEAAKLEEDYTRVSLLKSYLRSRGYPLEALAEVYNVFPDGIALSDIRFDEQGKLTMKGSAESMPVIFTFIEKIKKSKFFKEAKNKYSSQRKEGEKELVDFEIACVVNKNAQR